MPPYLTTGRANFYRKLSKRQCAKFSYADCFIEAAPQFLAERLRKVQWLASEHPVGKWQSWDPRLVILPRGPLWTTREGCKAAGLTSGCRVCGNQKGLRPSSELSGCGAPAHRRQCSCRIPMSASFTWHGPIMTCWKSTQMFKKILCSQII